MLFKRLFLTFLFLTTSSVLAFTPSAAQIEQFKKLPKAQQEALARQYGVDLSTITGKATSEESLEVESTIQPRLEKEEEQLTDEERFAPKESEVEPFGYDIFAGEPTSFMPSENAAVPDTYLIGPKSTTYSKLMYSNVIGCLTAMYDAEQLGKKYMPLIRKRQDMGLWLDILKETATAYCLQEPLATYRVGVGMSANKIKILSYQWRFYRDVAKLNFFRAIFTFSVYALKGFSKHRQ